MQIDGQDGGDAANASIAAREDPAVSRTVSHRDHPFWVRSGLVSALEGFAHVGGDRARYEQHIGVAWRCHKTNAESLQIVQDIVKGVDLEFAAIAGARIDLANGKRSTQPPSGRTVHLRCKFSHGGIVPDRCRLGKRPVYDAPEK